MIFLLIGDIYSDVGRKMTAEWIPKIKQYYLSNRQEIDFIIANGENTTHGKSISLGHYNELKRLGIDVITSGNHIFAPSTDIQSYIGTKTDILRPINYNPYHPGIGTTLIHHKNGKRIRVTNLIGRTFMDKADNPYFALEKVINSEKTNNELKSDIHIVDIHAEATAEKLAIAWNFDGELTCVFGTHTHVQTADNRLLPKKTAFISDIGMTGPYESIIGTDPAAVIYRDKKQLPARFEPATGKGQFAAAILTTDDKTNLAVKIERILITPDKSNLIIYA